MSGEGRICRWVSLIIMIKLNHWYISHVGCCHSDIHVKDNDWGGSKTGITAGHEGVGYVVGMSHLAWTSAWTQRVDFLIPAIGNNTVGSPVNIGDRVGMKWFANACLKSVHMPAASPSSYFLSKMRDVSNGLGNLWVALQPLMFPF